MEEKVDSIVKTQSTILETQNKILEVQRQTLNKQGKMIEEQKKMQEEQKEMRAEQSKIREEQKEMRQDIKNLSKRVDKAFRFIKDSNETIIEIKKDQYQMLKPLVEDYNRRNPMRKIKGQFYLMKEEKYNIKLIK